MKQKVRLLFGVLLLVANPFGLVASELEKSISKSISKKLSKTVDKETQLSAWTFNDGNFQLELIQRSPQQTRSFFQGRGFSSKVADDIALSCVFQTIGRNTEADNKTDSVTVDLSEWRLVLVDVKGNKSENENENAIEKPIKLKEDWAEQWKNSDIKPASRIAFRWATYPTVQSYDPGGDFNWGMISMGPKPEATFDLHIFWKQGEQQHDAWIRQMQCPADQPE